MSTTTGPVRVQVTLRGDVDYRAGDDARAAIADAIATAHCQVRAADVLVRLREEVTVACPAEVEAVVDVGDTVVHASSTARTVSEAIDVVEKELSARLVRHNHQVQTARRVPRGRRNSPPRRG